MIVIPMAGLSSRFKKAGYNLPKYMLEAKGKTLFEHSVGSFRNYFDKERFLFIALSTYNTKDFINKKCIQLGVAEYDIVILDEPTKGQAETVYLGLKDLDFKEDFSVTIFNIDTFRPNFTYPAEFALDNVDGYLETFIGSGKNWSNVLPAFPGSSRVVSTAEKQEVSKYCCTGLYFWKSAMRFMELYDIYQSKPVVDAGEYYVAPMYNELIALGGQVCFSVIDPDEVIFCGIPSEYLEFKESNLL